LLTIKAQVRLSTTFSHQNWSLLHEEWAYGLPEGPDENFPGHLSLL